MAYRFYRSRRIWYNRIPGLAPGSFIGNEGKQASLQITQHVADIVLLEAIAEFIEHGKVNVQYRNDGRAQAILIIYDKSILKEKIIPLCSGNLKCLKKTIQFSNWVKYHFPEINISRNINNIIHPEWLIGFIDGDGSFYPVIHKAKD